MKKLLIVDVPEWRPEIFAKQLVEFFAKQQVEFKEVTLPSEEDKYDLIRKLNPNKEVGSMNYIRWSEGFEAYNNWLLTKIKGE